MIRTALCWTVLFVGQFVVAAAQIYPVCEVCGCNWCAAGYRSGDPGAIIIVPDELRRFSDNLMEVPCNLIENLGLSGRVPPDLCTDAFRLSTDLRSVCGCPPLPPKAEPTTIGSPLAFAPTQPVAAPNTPAPTRVARFDLSSIVPTVIGDDSSAPSQSPTYLQALGTSSQPTRPHKAVPFSSSTKESGTSLSTTAFPIASPSPEVAAPSRQPDHISLAKGSSKAPVAKEARAPTPATGKGFSQAPVSKGKGFRHPPTREPTNPPQLAPAAAASTKTTNFRDAKGRTSESSYRRKWPSASKRGKNSMKMKKKHHSEKSSMKKMR